MNDEVRDVHERLTKLHLDLRSLRHVIMLATVAAGAFLVISVGVVAASTRECQRCKQATKKAGAPQPVPMREPINENDLAVKVSKREGGAVNLNIAELKQVQRILLEELSRYNDSQIMELINKHRKTRDKQ